MVIRQLSKRGSDARIYRTLASWSQDGVIEFYMGTDTMDADFTVTANVYTSGRADLELALRICNSKFEYYEKGWQDSGTAAAINTWYHISIRYRHTGGDDPEGDGLLEGEWGVKINEGGFLGPYDMEEDTGCAVLEWETANNDDTYAYGYWDAHGWKAWASYDAGDNLSLEADTDITAYYDECTISNVIRAAPRGRVGIWGQTFLKDNLIKITDTTTDYYHCHPLQNGLIYKDSLNFRGETLGSFPADTSQGTWTDNCGGSTDIRMIDKYNGHAYVMQMEDYDAADGAEAYFEFTSGQTSGSIEFWVATADITQDWRLYLLDEGNGVATGVRIDASIWQFYDDTPGWLAFPGAPTAPLTAKWYRITYTFDCSDDSFSITIVDEDDTAIASTGAKGMTSSPTTINKLWFITANADSDYLVFIDAIGLSWDTDYTLGDNADLDITLTAQTIFEGRVLSQDKSYIQDIDLDALSMELEQYPPGYDANYNPDGYSSIGSNYSEEVYSEIITDKANNCTATKTTELFRGTYSFDNEANGVIPFGWRPFGTAGKVVVDTGSTGSHTRILKITDDDATRDYAYHYFEAQTAGTIEFYVRMTDVTDTIYIYVLDANAGNGIKTWITTDNFYYYDGAAHIMQAVADNTWYQVRFTFDIDVADKYYVWIDGVSMDGGAGYDFDGNPLSLRVIQIFNQPDNNGTISYFDAFGFSWDNDYIAASDATSLITYQNSHIYIERFQAGAAAIDFSLDGEYMINRLGNMIDVLDGYVWTVSGNHKISYNDGSIDCQVDIATGDWRDCIGLEAIERFNCVVCKGGFNAGARVIGEADNTNSQSTYGIIPIVRFFATLTTEATLDLIADSILTLQENAPKVIELDYRNVNVGMLPVGQTLSIPASTIFYDKSDLTYVEAGEWLIVKNTYDPRRMNNHLILTNYLYFEYDWKLDQELESLVNQA